MTELIRGDLALFRFPRLFLDYVSGRLPKELDAPVLLNKSAVEAAKGRVDRGPASGATEFWAGVRDYDALRGAGDTTLRNIEALRTGGAVPVVTGQQPGLFGGPLYTVYKTLSAVALCEHARQLGDVEAVPVLWNACDDADFVEVSSASFFTMDLERKKFSAAQHGHAAGQMVGSLGVEPIREAVHELWGQFGDDVAVYRGTAFVNDILGKAMSRSRDWGQFFSSLFLSLFDRWGLVVIDAREASRSPQAAPVFSAYLRNSATVEHRVLESLRQIRQLGYEEPVSSRSAESCVFVREGELRRKPSREEHPRLLAHADKGDADLLPNVLLGPVLRDRLTSPLAQVLGPSEVCYSVLSRVVSSTLGFEQGSVFPRLSLTVVPAALTGVLGRQEDLVAEMVLAFDRRLQDHVEKSMSSAMKKDLEGAENGIRSSLERLKLLAAAAGRGVEDVTGSASRKIDFELKRVREEFVLSAKKKVLSENPMLRAAGEFLLPNGNLQERGFCSLAPLVRAGESFLTELKESASLHVADCLEGRIHHDLMVSGMV